MITFIKITKEASRKKNLNSLKTLRQRILWGLIFSFTFTPHTHSFLSQLLPFLPLPRLQTFFTYFSLPPKVYLECIWTPYLTLPLTYPQMDTRKAFCQRHTKENLFHFSCVRFNFLLRQSRACSYSRKRCRRRRKIYGPFFVLLVILLFQGISVVSVYVLACLPDKFQKSWWVWEEKNAK